MVVSARSCSPHQLEAETISLVPVSLPSGEWQDRYAATDVAAMPWGLFTAAAAAAAAAACIQFCVIWDASKSFACKLKKMVITYD